MTTQPTDAELVESLVSAAPTAGMGLARAALLERLGELRADAERYRWMRMATKSEVEHIRSGLFWGAQHLDDAIDAHLAERPSKSIA